MSYPWGIIISEKHHPVTLYSVGGTPNISNITKNGNLVTIYGNITWNGNLTILGNLLPLMVIYHIFGF